MKMDYMQKTNLFQPHLPR